MVISAVSASVAVAGLAIAGAAGAAAAAAQPVTTAPAVRTLPGSVAPFTSHTRAIGNVPAAERLTIQLWLRPRTAAATRFARAVSTPGSRQFRRYLSPDAYTARFGATRAGVGTVESWLRARGFTSVSADPQRAYVRATAPASIINHALDVRLKLYKSSAAVSADGYALRSNSRPVSLPARLARLVLGVTGLDNAAPADPRVAPAATASCSHYYGQHQQGGLPRHFGRTSFPVAVCGYSARQLRQAYGANMANTGKGETIALTEQAPPDRQDLLILRDYAKVSGLRAPSAKRFAEKTVGKGCSTATSTSDTAGGQRRPAAPPLDIEEQMDVEAAYAMAPGAKELVVAGAGCGSDPIVQGYLNADEAIVDGSGHHPLASITSNSWESDPESGQSASVTKIEHAYLLRAAGEGVGMYFATDDSSGVYAPSDDPYAIAVGGTTLGIGRTGSRLFETGWSTGLLADQKGKWVNEGELDAAGGGPSAVWKQPAYQRGVVPAALARAPGHSGAYRSVPDISADADPTTGMAVGLLSVQQGKKPRFFLTTGGGTSQATPLVAGLVAAAQQGQKAPFGFLNPVLYKLAGTSALHDVLPLTAKSPAALRGAWCDAACGGPGLVIYDVQSTDKSQGYAGQVTLKGYDNMSGLGTPDGQAFIKALRAGK
jgi:subtilase family serine protease